ncbi:hypothetical protein C3747_31g1637c [Trypanosoma cruzi]|uniref:Uncharacterized protein n=2 Tax=Trypanosoma cruzi TaxID=5693 RepID=Q4CUW6_TRYCC|nr:hypothetical protein, conserved [Trypanosoma cruzi]XP_811594.1 hypothetical protein, conserved [Trypanosoma cruzi]PBJ76890.1 hypothetical protein BCY84_07688 [Trypanosoma cruzi cruzi]EAN84069.1 hypothetical protein, conserved [Trypanosoma cruzi]EAN89743.1 hypothetical protein, conserved [Trypanosoma cruzi]KAF8278387.1 putative Mitochondrial ATP synthase subunit [Trypanosoma cruzi]KAF8290419.1 putative Mitochondrial ATP synthase subunit [Trypanosoma cruzi]|eukprot:XP_805920.1 hypothetical protein [Trypanosoma cruzi strain CL Brener]
MSFEFAFHDVSNDAIKHMTPSEALQKHLENAQLAHRVCVAKALKAEEAPVEKCALTWGEVLIRYQAWAEYRPPFQDSVAQSKYKKYWTKKRQAEDDKNPFK